MKKSELKTLKEKKIAELAKIVSTKKLEAIKDKAGMHVGKVKNLKKARILRKEIAQILTIIKEKGSQV